MAIIALHCPHIKVIVADINKKQIEKWNSGHSQHSHRRRLTSHTASQQKLTHSLCPPHLLAAQTCFPSTSLAWTMW